MSKIIGMGAKKEINSMEKLKDKNKAFAAEIKELKTQLAQAQEALNVDNKKQEDKQ